MSTSVCWSHVYPTSHMLTTASGPAYSASTDAAPTFVASAASAATIATTPTSDCHTFDAQPLRTSHSADEKGRAGTKWFDVPYFGPPVAPHSRYAGQPITRWRTSWSAPHGPLPNRRALASSASPPVFSIPARPPTTAGTCVSPLVMWFVCPWCTACECCHEKYGTRSTVCRR